MRKNKLFTVSLLAIVFAIAASAEKVSRIEYSGIKRIEKETIETYLPIQVGDDCDEDIINEALKALNRTGFFEEVSIKMKGNTLMVNVKEFPMINKVSFEGNSKLSDREIKKAIKLDSRETLSPSKIKEIQQSLLETYRRLGRYNASVNPKVIKLPDNRVNLVFEIAEGNEAGIGKIIFIGNEQVSSSELRDAIYSKVKRWYRFFSNDDVYDPDRMEEDKMAIARYYHENGFASARVISAVAELSADKKEFILTFTVDEGKIYSFGDVSVKSSVSKISAKDFEKDLYCKHGEKFDQSFLEVDSAAIAKQIGRKGFAAIRVIPNVVKNAEKGTVDVVFNITEGDKVYISKIVISGNTKTRDNVIRREIILEEGDAYNQALVNLAESNLRGLGFFQKVDIQTIPDPNAPDKCIMQVSVEETPTAEASVSASYSTSDGVGLELAYNESNFFGTGKSLSVFLGSSGGGKTGVSTETEGSDKNRKKKSKEKFRFLNNVNVSLTDPHIFDKDIKGSISGYRYIASKFDAFDCKELGGSLGISYDLSQHFSQSWEYSAANRKFSDINEDCSPIIREQVYRDVENKIAGRCNLSSLKHTIGYSNYFLRGLKGRFNISLSTTAAGLGGSAKHLKNELHTSYSMPVFRRTSLVFSLSAGLLSKLGNKKPHIVDSFVLGNETFRGFEYAGFGPRSATVRIVDKNGKKINRTRTDFIGAKKYWKGTVEYSFPMGLPEELQFRGFMFTDFGKLWDAPNKGWRTQNKDEESQEKTEEKLETDEKGDEYPEATCDFDSKVKAHKILDDRKLRMSVGLGVSFVTPFGPLKLAYAIPIKKQKYDEQSRFLIGFSTTF